MSTTNTVSQGWFLPSNEWSAVIAGLSSSVHPADLWQLPVDQPLTIALVRQLQSFSSQTPVGSSKLAILTGVDTWRIEVANALLKLLEEPPSYLRVTLLSVTDRILPTIRSRVQFERLAEQGIDSSDGWGRLWQSYLPINPENAARLQDVLYIRSLIHSGHNQNQIIQALLPH